MKTEFAFKGWSQWLFGIGREPTPMFGGRCVSLFCGPLVIYLSWKPRLETGNGRGSDNIDSGMAVHRMTVIERRKAETDDAMIRWLKDRPTSVLSELCADLRKLGPSKTAFGVTADAWKYRVLRELSEELRQRP